jgi:ABC-type branched-subunit amino acid transport system substrate-binding protein
MIIPRLARRRALTACAAVALAAAAAGCSAGAAAPTASGNKLAIYISRPPGGASDQLTQDVIDAEQLAFAQLKSRVTAYTLTLHMVSNAKISTSARTAIDNNNAIAYLGEIVPGSSVDSLGITNAVDLLQVSPTDGDVRFTQRTGGVAPSHYYEAFATYGHTFARMVPTSSHEAVALVHEMQSLGIHTLQVQTDGSGYAQALDQALASGARGASITLQSSGGADGVLYLGADASAAVSALNAAAAANPKARLFVGSALADPTFVAELSPAAQKSLYAIAPGLPPSAPAGAAQSFVSSFRTTYGHAPVAQAIFGYAAMQAVLHVLQQAGSTANNRSDVVRDFMKLSYTGSVLGSYQVTLGDTNLDSFVIEHVKAGRLEPIKTLQG